MTKKYPNIGQVDSREKATQAKCPCGEIAKFKSHIQWNYFRGEDDVVWSCDKHKRDVDFHVDEIFVRFREKSESKYGNN